MFGNQDGDRSGLNVSPGLNSGFKVVEMFTKVSGPNKTGGTWSAYDVKFEGGINVKQRIFVPTLKVTPSQYDADGLSRMNERGRIKNKPDLSMEEYLAMKNKQSVEDFISTINMYAHSFYVDESPEIVEKRTKRASYETVEAFIENVDTYIKETLEHIIPKNYRDASWDIILGKGVGAEYLEFPSKYYLTGRYVKLSTDTSRKLTISEKYAKEYMPANLNPQPTAKPIAAISW